MKNIFCVLLLVSFIIAGCATPYQRKGFTGGYSDFRIDANTFKVQFRGNAYTDRETVEAYVLYRCAELTLAAGFDYFIILRDSTEASTETGRTPAFYQSYYRSGRYGSFYIPSQFIHMTRYQAYVTIKSFSGKKPQSDLAAFDAREVIQYLYVTKKGEQSAESTGHEGKQDPARSEKVDITKSQPSQPQRHLQTPSQTTAAYKEQVVSASEYNNRGLEYYKNGQYNPAIEEFTRALSMENNSSYYINRGSSFYELKQYDNAISDFKQAINLAPNEAKGYFWCGNVYYVIKSYYEASEYFSKAIAIVPNNAVFYYNRGYAQFKIGNKSTAVSDFKKACELGDDDGCKQLKVLENK